PGPAHQYCRCPESAAPASLRCSAPSPARSKQPDRPPPTPRWSTRDGSARRGPHPNPPPQAGEGGTRAAGAGGWGRSGRSLARHRITVAQILLTLEDTEERRRHLNARATFAQLLGLGAVPVVNENDTIATAEIRFGDNDRLAARVAQMVSADMLVLLSDIDGFYSADPRNDPAARHIPLVRDLGPEIEGMAGSAPPGYSSGGMVTKLAAARIAMQAGCHMLIAEGRPKVNEMAGPLGAIEAGARATLFLPHSEPR